MALAAEIRNARPEDAEALATIYNHAVLHTLAIWNERTVSVENRTAWLLQRQQDGFPVLVAEHEGGILGYASYGPWRPFEGFRETVEHSVYVADGQQGQGLGRQLMEALITRARQDGLHVMVAGIEASNAGSLALHYQLGFVETARMPEVGQKFGRWLDLVFLQLKLDPREAP